VVLTRYVSFVHRTKKHGEDAPETANLYFSYGKALLENAISQASVLGKEQPENGDEAEEKRV
jgi:HAT1-interacting factor 1